MFIQFLYLKGLWCLTPLSRIFQLLTYKLVFRVTCHFICVLIGLKSLSTFSYVLNLKIDVVPKASHVVVIRRFSLNEAPLGLFKFISDYLPYFEKINIFFKIIAKKV
jgi:hypothetical protein